MEALMERIEQNIIGPESEIGERVERAKRNLDPIQEGVEGFAAHYCDDNSVLPAEVYGFDPRGEAKRPNYERTSYQPKACSFNQILELWAAHEGGSLKRATHVPGQGGEGYGEDDALRAWEWVARTPGWSPIIHEVMRHLVLRNRTWDQWPVAASVKCSRVFVGDEHSQTVVFAAYCEWPFISKEQAGAAWIPFYRELRKRYRLDPFTIFEQRAELA